MTEENVHEARPNTVEHIEVPASPIEVNTPTTPWYETQVVGFLVGVVVSLSLLWFREYLERRRRRESLLMALHGEVNSIRGYLRRHTKTLKKCTETKTRVKRFDLNVHKVVFLANAGNLGDLRDAFLVKEVVNFYEFLGRLDEMASRIQDGTYPVSDAWPEYVYEASGLFHMAVIVDMKLAKRARRVKAERDGDYKLTKQDADDRNLSVSLQKWAVKDGGLDYPETPGGVDYEGNPLTSPENES